MIPVQISKQRRPRLAGRFVVLALPVLALGLLMSDGALAKPARCELPVSMPEKVRIAVFGDSVARGYWRGLTRAFKGDRRVRILRKAKSGTGLVRRDVYDWNKAAKKATRSGFDIALVSIGGNDRQNFRINRKRVDKGTQDWKREYKSRARTFVRLLKKKGALVYWVGLPVVKSPRMDRDFMMFNRIFRELAAEEGLEFIDTSGLMRDRKGRFTAFGQTLKGKKRRLRKRDGTHFTRPGNDVMARFIKKRLCRSAQVVGAR